MLKVDANIVNLYQIVKVNLYRLEFHANRSKYVQRSLWEVVGFVIALAVPHIRIAVGIAAILLVEEVVYT